MSPHVSSFVHDLVAMAQATERLPALEREVDRLNTMVEEYANQVQSLELRAIERKNEIDELVAKILTAEVARDDAELRFLEVEDNAHHILNQAKDMQAVIGAMIAKLDPPKATPEPVASEAQLEEAVAVDTPETKPDLAWDEIGPYNQPEDVQDTAPTTTSEPTPRPYAGLRYYDHPIYVHLDEWLSGGGTQADYDWRPEAKAFGSF